jgi:predicted enzyme related to lactoylglutathione lyase
MIAHVKAVAVYVEDQGQALDFYTQKLGFEVRRNEPMGPRGNWVEPPRAMGWGTYARFADPDGNEFLLTTPKGA